MLNNNSKNIWVIGDVQGCCVSLESLLDLPDIKNDPDCELWFAGDLINRGPNSLRALRLIMSLGDRAKCILGNHDLHLLAVHAGIRRENRSDTIDDILCAADVESIIDWLRHRPLAYYEDGYLMVHAGILPEWSTKKTLKLAEEIGSALRDKNWKKYLQKMYGNEPNKWNDDLSGAKRRRVIINALTRMRMCTPDGAMDFGSKEAPSYSKNVNLLPWFDMPDRKTEEVTVIFFLFSTLSLMVKKNLLALDTGCVWGGKLTAIRLQDRKVLQVDCHTEHRLAPV